MSARTLLLAQELQHSKHTPMLPLVLMSTATALTPATVRRAPDAPPLVTATAFPPARHFIGGVFVDASTDDVVDVIDPCSEDVLIGTPAGTAEDVDRAVAAATVAKGQWARVVPKDRSELLHAIGDRLADNDELLTRLEAAKTGKPLAVARDDIVGTIDTFRFMAGALRGTTGMAAGEYVANHLSVIHRKPLGAIGLVTPVELRADDGRLEDRADPRRRQHVGHQTVRADPLTTLKFAELVADLLPRGVVNVISGLGPTVGTRLAQHPDVDMIALTGSVGSGRAVARAAADDLKRVHLELGGKAPVVVFPDADLAAVASALREADYWNSGQECGAACRVLVHESVADTLVQQLAAEVATLVVGEPSAGDDVEIGPLVSKTHFDRVLGYLNRATNDGTRAVVGGSAIDGPGYFVAPTVLVDIPEDAEITREEDFGPVVTVETFTDEDEAVRRANDVPYGLSASVWTENACRCHTIAARLDFGTVWVNSHLALANEVPWGGYKGSGYGRDLSIYAPSPCALSLRVRPSFSITRAHKRRSRGRRSR